MRKGIELGVDKASRCNGGTGQGTPDGAGTRTREDGLSSGIDRDGTGDGSGGGDKRGRWLNAHSPR